MPDPPRATPTQPIFYYDLGSPECYLVAEQISWALPVIAEWEPVLASQVAGIDPNPDRQLIERLAEDLGLQRLRWPPRWPPETRTAMLTATYAKRVGRAVAFSLAAFRQAFAGGRDLGEQDTVLIAAAACEMHPTALLKAISLRSVTDALEIANARAVRAGVSSLPAIQIGTQTFHGADVIDEAARALEEQR